MAAEADRKTPVVGVWLEIDLDSEPITGMVRLADEPPQPFAGWLGLTAFLESSRTMTRLAAPRTMPRLTRTESEIVALVGEGLTNPQIAECLSVSPRTIQGHLLKVFRKAGVSSRTALATKLLRSGALPPPSSSRNSSKNAPSVSQESSPASQTMETASKEG